MARILGPSLHRRGIMGLVVALLLILVIGVVAASFFFHGPYMMGSGPYYPHPYFGWFFFPIGFIFFILAVSVIFRLAFWPWRRRMYSGHWHRWDDAHDILRQRYARGEITKDQFAQMQRDLDEHS